MSIQIKALYRCGECRELHDDEDESRECCMPEVHECFECPVCKEVHDEEGKASSCCGFSVAHCPGCARDYGAGCLDHAAVTISGHCRACNPFYTVDQQLAIEDLHWQATGKAERLNA